MDGGTRSTRLHRDTNKPDRQLFHDDIERSKPMPKGLFPGNRCVDPLEPHYILPSYVPASPARTKFTRDSFDVSDIEGSKPRPLYPFRERRNHIVDDIEGAQSGWRPRHLRARYDSEPLNHTLDVSDITGGGFRSQRETNPLTPSYRVNGMDIAHDPVTFGPRPLPKARNGPFYPLMAADIEGAQPGWRPMPQMNPPLQARRHFRNTNFIGDIPGARADSIKHSICTNRQINPLDPVYASLDGQPLGDPATPFYDRSASAEVKLRERQTTAGNRKTLSGTTPGRISTASSKSGVSVAQADRKAGIGTATSSHQKTAERDCQEQPSSGQLILSPKSHAVTCPSDGRIQRKGGGDTDDVRRSGCERHGTVAVEMNGNSTSEQREKNHQWVKCKMKSLAHRPRVSGNSTGEYKPTLTRSPGLRSSQEQEKQRPVLDSVSCRPAVWPQVSAGTADRQQVRTSDTVGGTGTRGSKQDRKIFQEFRREIHRAREYGNWGREDTERAERLVLRSANGIPRVPLTPSEEKNAFRHLEEEVQAVRGLP